MAHYSSLLACSYRTTINVLRHSVFDRIINYHCIKTIQGHYSFNSFDIIHEALYACCVSCVLDNNLHTPFSDVTLSMSDIVWIHMAVDP